MSRKFVCDYFVASMNQTEVEIRSKFLRKPFENGNFILILTI